MSLVAVLAAAAVAATQGFPAAVEPGQRMPGARGQGNDATDQACAADKQQFCATVQPGGGRYIQCYRENWSKLSGQCREQLERRARQR